MSDRFAYLYGPFVAFNLRTLVEYFSSRGITLQNPANGRVTALSEEGNQIDLSLDALEDAVANHDLLTFQFWMPDDADICCRFRHLSDGRLVEEYSLVGLYPEERDRALSALAERFKSKTANEDNLFFVADSEGYTLEVDWDALSLEGRYELALCPDMLGFPVDRMNDFQKCAGGSKTTKLGKYIMLKPNQ